MATTEQKQRAARIALLNDQARKAMGVLCRAYQTEGIQALDPLDQSAIRERVETFDDFIEDNDPWGEHDFGSFQHECIDGDVVMVFWKMDYYDRAMEYGSEDPLDVRNTTRVLTILLNSEY